MSVLIKSMKMPESCLECKLKYEFEGLGIWFCSCLSSENSDTDVSRNGKPLDLRPDYCPLIEVSEPHGRLIDGDLLYSKVDDISLGYYEVLGVTEEEIENAPTVIPREDGEKHDEP